MKHFRFGNTVINVCMPNICCCFFGIVLLKVRQFGMDNFNKKEVIQAILIADNNTENFLPFSEDESIVSGLVCRTTKL